MSLDTPAGRAVIEAGGSLLATDYGLCRDTIATHQAQDAPGRFLNERELQQIVEELVAAALAVRVPCEPCGGSGFVELADDHPARALVDDDSIVDQACRPCRALGTVSALRVLLDEGK